MRIRYKELSLQQLRAFREVCENGSYADVARDQGLSTSAIWEQVSALEKRFDVKLVEKTSSGIQPTPDGELFLHLCGPLLAGLESLPAVFQQARGDSPEKLTVAAGMRMLMEEVSIAVPQFHELYPSTRVQTLYADDDCTQSRVGKAKADLGIILTPHPNNVDANVVVEPAYSYEYLVVACRKHPLFDRKEIRLKDITKWPLVVGIEGALSRRRIDEVFHQHALTDEVKVLIETNSSTITVSHVRHSNYLGIVTGLQAPLAKSGLCVASLGKWFGSADYSFVWPKGALVPKASRQFADLVRKVATET